MTSAASLAAASTLPGRLAVSSHLLGWNGVLARVYEEPPVTPEFSTPAVPELLVVVQLNGTSSIESKRGGGWARAEYGPGSIGMTAPGNDSTLRWQRSSDPPPWTLHVHLDVGLLRGAAHVLGRPHVMDALPDALLLRDPLVLATGQALGTAATLAATPLHAEALAQALAAAIVDRCIPAHRRRPVAAGPVLTPREVARIVEYMNAHLGEPVHLDDLAAVVHLSRYHFLRAFARTTGSTPHRYLTELRMLRAAERLRSTELPVSALAGLHGFASPSQFRAAFRRHHGCSPGEYRRSLRE